MIYLVTYDIADDERRAAVSAILAAYGARVQLSVFECHLADQAMLEHLKGSLRKVIEPVEDQVRIYPLPADSLRAIHILGERRLEELEDFWIV